jgi:hypothetical protein
MTTAITIVYDAVNKTHLTLTWEVEEESGTHICIHAHSGPNDPEETMESMWESAALLVGIPNVRVFQATVWEPSLQQMLKVDNILLKRQLRNDRHERITLVPEG